LLGEKKPTMSIVFGGRRGASRVEVGNSSRFRGNFRRNGAVWFGGAIFHEDWGAILLGGTSHRMDKGVHRKGGQRERKRVVKGSLVGVKREIFVGVNETQTRPNRGPAEELAESRRERLHT